MPRMGNAIVAGFAVSVLSASAMAQWGANGNNLYYLAGNVGVRTNTPGASVHAISSSPPSSIAVLGAGYAGAPFSIGVRGISYSSSGYGGLFDGGKYGILSRAQAASGDTFGVWGQVTSPTGYGGVFKGGRFGVWGESSLSNGYAGYFLGRGYFSGNVGIGIGNPAYPLHIVSSRTPTLVATCTATSGASAGIKGTCAAPDGLGVWGVADHTLGVNYGVAGTSHSRNGTGTRGTNLATSGDATGVNGLSQSPTGIGVWGIGNAGSTINYGLLGTTVSLANGWGTFSEGSSGGTGFKAFSIDHPLDPANKYLNHFSAEGPEALLINRGSVHLDDAGEAWVELPEYFESINKDVTYQLTPVGGPMLALHVADEVKNNRFRIAGGTPGLKVCWTVMGARNDAFARAYPKDVEQAKPAEHKGRYLHPELYGQPSSKRLRAIPALEARPPATPLTPAEEPVQVPSVTSPIAAE
jgi:hypothetical protein